MPANHIQAETDGRRRILFVAEAVSLAHVARPAVLARMLEPEKYDVCFASDSRFDSLFGDLPFDRYRLYSVSSESFLLALAKGSPIYKTSTLRRYVRDDLELISSLSPDLIVGDFRLSLTVSARIANIPYLSITNAYWSPYARQRYPIPEHIMARVLGVNLAEQVFRVARPVIFAFHAIPLNRVRREWGQDLLGANLGRVYTDADHVLYADVPGFIDMRDLPENHHFIGPILWSPPQAYPDWWDRVATDRPIIYVTPGSTGDDRLLSTVLAALADMPVRVIAATAGRFAGTAWPGNAYLAKYLPGIESAERSSLVICNGGSPTTQQALAAGKPVIGICSNLDQYLNMQAVQQFGAGFLMRSGKVTASDIQSGVKQLLENPRYGLAAKRMAENYQMHDAGQRFNQLLDKILA